METTSAILSVAKNPENANVTDAADTAWILRRCTPQNDSPGKCYPSHENVILNERSEEKNPENDSNMDPGKHLLCYFFNNSRAITMR